MEILHLEIPKGLRAGKYLRRHAPRDFGDDFSPLVQSLDYWVFKARSDEEWLEALKSCNSCQSNNRQTRQTYLDVWSSVITRNNVIRYDDKKETFKTEEKIGNITLLILRDKKTGNIVARSLVNLIRKTYAPVYGEKHFLLEARLRYFGFTLSEIASPVEISTAVTLVERKNVEQDILDKPKKSEVEYKIISMKNPEMEYFTAVANIARWKEKNQYPGGEKYVPIPGYKGSLQKTEGWYRWKWSTSRDRSELNKKMEEAKAAMGRWKKHCRLAGKDITCQEVSRQVEIRRFAYNRKTRGDMVWVESSLYNDSKREFVEVGFKPKKGWWSEWFMEE